MIGLIDIALAALAARTKETNYTKEAIEGRVAGGGSDEERARMPPSFVPAKLPDGPQPAEIGLLSSVSSLSYGQADTPARLDPGADALLRAVQNFLELAGDIEPDVDADILAAEARGDFGAPAPEAEHRRAVDSLLAVALQQPPPWSQSAKAAEICRTPASSPPPSTPWVRMAATTE